MTYTLHHGDCLEVLRSLPDCSVDSVVTDPPYGLSFMGKKWDYDVPAVEVWQECLRVLKPGGHLLAFAGTRTQHRMAVRIEDAGFEIRDMIAWVYGSGFPKSLDVSKAIDKAAGAERTEVVGRYQPPGMDKPWNLTQAKDERGVGIFASSRNNLDITAPATDAARQWQGWGTALKPALEPITVARKPLVGTVAENVMEHGTGAINVDGCRVGTDGESRKICNYASQGSQGCITHTGVAGHSGREYSERVETAGRWPANLIHDGSEEVLRAFPQAPGQQGDLKETGRPRPSSGRFGDMAPPHAHPARVESEKSAARFFYCAKASKKDRDEGNGHPTVKPTDLMRYLCRLVTRPGGTVLDPFTGSGSTGKAAMLEGFRFIGIERDPKYFAIASDRIRVAYETYIDSLL